MAIVVLSSCHDPAARRDLPPLLAELARHANARVTIGRLSITDVYRPCELHPRAAGGMPPALARCEFPTIRPSRELLEFAGRVSRRVSRTADPEALHAAGVLELLWAGEHGESLDNAIAYLRDAAVLAEAPLVLQDLGVAYLARSAKDGSVSDLVAALEVTSRAAELDPDARGLGFNTAVILHRLGLHREASREVTSYAERVSAGSPWLQEAHTQVTAPVVTRDKEHFPTRAMAREDAPEFVAAHASHSRDLALKVLGEWGRGLIDRDSTASADALGLARAIGEALVAAGGDHSIAEFVGIIDAEDDAIDLHHLAREHALLARGVRLLEAGDPEGTLEALRAAAAFEPRSEILRRWVRFYTASAGMQIGAADEAWQTLEGMIGEIDAARYPALAARVHSSSATILYRRGLFEKTIARLDIAAGLFRRAGERDVHGGILRVTADAQFQIGLRAAGYSTARRAIAIIAGADAPVFLHNMLLTFADAVGEANMPRAAMRIQNEGVAVASTVGGAIYAEALGARANLRLASGDTVGAARDLDVLSGLVDTLESPSWRRLLTIRRWLTTSAIHSSSAPERAVAAIDSALGSRMIRSSMRMMEAHVARAEARVHAGDHLAAIADLDTATILLDAQGDALVRSDFRIALKERTRAVTDRLVMLAARSAAPELVLEFLERGRVSFAVGPKQRQEEILEQLQNEGIVAVEYALIGDTLLTLVADGRKLSTRLRTVDGDSLVRTIERIRAEAEHGFRTRRTARELAGLYDLLIRPIVPSGRETKLLIIGDGELSGVPFAALRDTVRNRYLIEDHTLLFASSLADFPPRSASRERGGTILLAEDAHNDTIRVPGLAPLPGAAREIEEISDIYAGARTLTGARADRGELLRELAHARIFHFAGHAVLNSRTPTESFIVVGPHPISNVNHRVTARDLEGLDLSGLELVVLSGCETLGGRGSQGSGLSGFSAALLRAGAGGVVGSSWRVEDQATMALMMRFHREYARTGDGPGSLRAAQIALIRSDEPWLRRPAAWAGFRFAGR